MIDFARETLIPIQDVPKHVPTRPHYSTIFRWLNRGSRGVKLESLLIGGVRMTSMEALQRFFERTTAAAADGASVESSTPRHREAAIEAAEKRLAELGI